MELKLAMHSVSGLPMVEVFDNAGAFVAAIYTDRPNNGVRIVSKHIDAVDLDESFPPAINVKFKSNGQ